MTTDAGFSELIAAMNGGDGAAFDRAFAIVYAELRRLAHGQLARNRVHGTLSTTALVHEAYLKLAHPGLRPADRGHFFALAARAMRQVLIDAARRRKANKRDAGTPTTLDGKEVPDAAGLPPEDLLALDGALDRLSEHNARLGRLVELRFYGGLSEEEVAGLLGVSERTLRRDWALARAFLRRELAAGNAS